MNPNTNTSEEKENKLYKKKKLEKHTTSWGYGR